MWKPRKWHGFVLLWSQHFKSFQANSGQSILRSASLWKQPVTPFAKAGQRHCTWDESVLFNVSPVKQNETTWPSCLASVSSSRSGDSSVQITMDFELLQTPSIIRNSGWGFAQAWKWIPGQSNSLWHKFYVLFFYNFLKLVTSGWSCKSSKIRIALCLHC